MKLLEWIRQKRNPTDNHGERLATGWRNHFFRQEYDLPDQQKAWFIDKDGERSYHVLDLQRNGEPHGAARIGKYVEDGSPPEYKSYTYSHQADGYLIYHEDDN